MNEKNLTMTKTVNALSVLFDMIEIMRAEIDTEMSVQQVQVFLAVALSNKTTQHEIGEKIGLSKASMSRNVAALGPVNRFRNQGHDLFVIYEDPAYRKQKLIELSPKGKRLVKKLETLIERRCGL